MVAAAVVEALRLHGIQARMMYGEAAWIEVMENHAIQWAGCWNGSGDEACGNSGSEACGDTCRSRKACGNSGRTGTEARSDSGQTSRDARQTRCDSREASGQTG